MNELEERFRHYSKLFGKKNNLFNASKEEQLLHANDITDWCSLTEEITTLPLHDSPSKLEILRQAFNSSKSLFLMGDDITAWLGQLNIAQSAAKNFPGEIAAFQYSVSARYSAYMNLLDEADEQLGQMAQHFTIHDHALAQIFEELKGIVCNQRGEWEQARSHFDASIMHLGQCADKELEKWTHFDKKALVANRTVFIADCMIHLGWEADGQERLQYAHQGRFFLEKARNITHVDVEQFMAALNYIEVLLLEGHLTEARERINGLVSEQKNASPRVATVYPLLYCLLARLNALEDDLQTMIAHLSTALLESHICHHALQESQIVNFALKLLQRKKVDLKQIEPIFKAMVIMLEAKDWYTGHGHSKTVSELSLVLWESWNKEPLQSDDMYMLKWAAYLHDIGKLLLPRSLLSKIAPLREVEFTILRKHPIISQNILTQFGDDRIAQLAGEHHQDAAGQGYPGEHPASAKGLCIAIADIIEAATSTGRLYRQPKSVETVVQELREQGDQRYPQELTGLVIQNMAKLRR